MSEDTIKSITEDFKSLLIKSKKDLQGKKKVLKQYAAIVKTSKEEYQRCLNENQQLKKRIDKYENYFKQQQQQRHNEQQQQLIQQQKELLKFKQKKKKRNKKNLIYQNY